MKSYELQQLTGYLETDPYGLKKTRTDRLEIDVHGMERTRKLQEELPRGTRINRIVFRYSDGKMSAFIPETGWVNFSADDVHELVKVLEKASSTAEWSEVDSSIWNAGG